MLSCRYIVLLPSLCFSTTSSIVVFIFNDMDSNYTSIKLKKHTLLHELNTFAMVVDGALSQDFILIAHLLFNFKNFYYDVCGFVFTLFTILLHFYKNSMEICIEVISHFWICYVGIDLMLSYLCKMNSAHNSSSCTKFMIIWNICKECPYQHPHTSLMVLMVCGDMFLHQMVI